jgi:hypothetical protein
MDSVVAIVGGRRSVPVPSLFHAAEALSTYSAHNGVPLTRPFRMNATTTRRGCADVASRSLTTPS